MLCSVRDFAVGKGERLTAVLDLAFPTVEECLTVKGELFSLC